MFANIIGMSEQDPAAPHEVPQGPIHISEENAISIDQALEIAQAENVPLAKSTLQRWALKWKKCTQRAQSNPSLGIQVTAQ
jgi:hypothetical protein